MNLQTYETGGPFNCSDYVPTTNQAMDVCEFPRESFSFCTGDGNEWWLFWCPIACHHSNCTEYWITEPPTPTPIITTIFESTEIPSDTPTISPSIPPTQMTIISTFNVSNNNEEETTETDIDAPVIDNDGDDNDRTLILILILVLLACIAVAAFLLWICVNLVKLQKEHNYLSFNTLAAMTSRTPDYYTHPGGAPSTPDYYRTNIQHNSHRDPFQRG